MGLEPLTRDTDPRPLRRIVFATEPEWLAARENLDRLLAWCWAAQEDFICRLPESRNRQIAMQKLEEFACYVRLAMIDDAWILKEREDQNRAPNGNQS